MSLRKTEVIGKFSTPIWTGLLNNSNEINTILLNHIGDIKNKNPDGVRRSNTLGWHSPDLDLQNENIKKFFSLISPMIKEVSDDMKWNLTNFQAKVLSCWAIINKKFASNAGHIHANSIISSAYYIKASEGCGNLIFDDPRPAAQIKKPPYTSLGKWNEGNVSVTPKTGLLVMFPSYLVHHVQPNMSESDRVIMSFNIDVVNK